MGNRRATPLTSPRAQQRAADADARRDALARDVLGLVADKWTLVIIEALDAGPLRFTRLKASVQGISQKVLTAKLRTLEQHGLVTRDLHAAVPPRVEYALTPLGRSLGEAVCSIWLWAEEHAPEVDAHRRAFVERTPRDDRPARADTFPRPAPSTPRGR
jgi:DNA-binding HxlR family transcriptional regulator